MERRGAATPTRGGVLGGVRLADDAGAEFTWYPIPLERHRLMGMVEDDDGTLLLSVYDFALYRFDPRTGSAQRVSAAEGGPHV